MRIGVDARFLSHPQPGGFKTYTENLVAGLAAVDRDNDYILYIDRPTNLRPPRIEGRSFAIRVVPGTFPTLGMPWREQVLLPLYAARDQIDMLHSLALTAPLSLRRPIVVTVHDTYWHARHRRPALGASKRALLDAYYRYVPLRAIRRAAAIVTVSQSAKASLVEELGVPAERIFVTLEAPAPIFAPVADPVRLAHIRRKYQLGERFILGMGSADPRKNVVTLLRAYAELSQSLREQYDLVVVWAHGALIAGAAATLQHLGLDAGVRFLTAVPKQDLAMLYSAATVFVFPSLAEGFGLPPLEAMGCGTPVIASNSPAMPEVLDGAAWLVDAQDVHAMAVAIERVLFDDGVRASLIQAGQKRAAAFSWTKCAEETVQVYRDVLLRVVGVSAVRA
jgi:glycosyltransferase involved in cell wall biosynthesis